MNNSETSVRPAKHDPFCRIILYTGSSSFLVLDGLGGVQAESRGEGG